MTVPTLVTFIRGAGAVQLAIVAANVLLPRRLATSTYLPRLSRILRQIFIVHWLYIGFVLVIFGTLSLLFAPELAGASPLGQGLSLFLALFWAIRVWLQLFYYDRTFMRENRGGHLAMTLAALYLTGVFSAAALRIGP